MNSIISRETIQQIDRFCREPPGSSNFRDVGRCAGAAEHDINDLLTTWSQGLPRGPSR
jgi:hypothetical protein